MDGYQGHKSAASGYGLGNTSPGHEGGGWRDTTWNVEAVVICSRFSPDRKRADAPGAHRQLIDPQLLRVRQQARPEVGSHQELV